MDRPLTRSEETYQSNSKYEKASLGLEVTVKTAGEPCVFVFINSSLKKKFKYDYVLSGGKVSASISANIINTGSME